MSGPTRAHLRELVELGQWLDSVAELDGDPGRVSPRARAALLWSPPAKALIVLGGYALPRARAARPAELDGKAARVYETWTRGREASRVRELELELPPGRWVELGRAESIGYRSDKFHARGAVVDYEHKFGPGVRLYRLGEDRRGLLAWRGGRLRLTEDGIEG